MKFLEARRLGRGGGNAAPSPARETKMLFSPVEEEKKPREVRASSFARKLAAELGLDLASIAGTGADGLITLEDVRKAGGITG